MGTPSTSTMTSCARATGVMATTAKATSAATTKVLPRARIGIFDIVSCPPLTTGPPDFLGCLQLHRNTTDSRQNLERSAHRSQGVGTERAQAELEHNRVVPDLALRRGIGVAGEPVHGQHETVVDIAQTEPALIELIVFDVIAGGAEHDPVLRHLERCAAKNALAARQEAE